MCLVKGNAARVLSPWREGGEGGVASNEGCRGLSPTIPGNLSVLIHWPNGSGAVWEMGTSRTLAAHLAKQMRTQWRGEEKKKEIQQTKSSRVYFFKTGKTFYFLWSFLLNREVCIALATELLQADVFMSGWLKAGSWDTSQTFLVDPDTSFGFEQMFSRLAITWEQLPVESQCNLYCCRQKMHKEFFASSFLKR